MSMELPEDDPHTGRKDLQALEANASPNSIIS